jgi:hypothetical protein
MPMGVIIIDEIHYFLGRLVSPKAGAWERSLVGQFNKLWGKSFGQYKTTAKVKNPSKIVRSPAISLFGASTPGDFWPLLQGTEVSNGFFSRLLVFESHLRPKLQIPPPPQVPAALKDDLIELYRFGITEPMKMAQLNDPNIEFDPQVLAWAGGGAAGGVGSDGCPVFQQLNDRIDRKMDDGDGKPEYLGRIVEQAMRLATICAAGRGGHRGKVDAADMTWGAGLAPILVTHAMKQAQDSWPENSRSQAAEKLDSLIVRRGSMTIRDIQQYVRSRYNSREITDILNQLVAAGRIVKLPNGSYAAPPKPNKTSTTPP